MTPSNAEHVPVLSEPLAEQISLPQDGVMVDATIGHGGHSFLFGQRLGPAGTLVGLDIDSKSLERARQRLACLRCKVILIKSNFSQIAERVGELGITEADFILADLGLCSAQLTDSEIGLSFRTDMPLDMRIDESLETTAADIVNGFDEEPLADLIYQYGQDRASRRIARYIVRRRGHGPITTTGQLAQVVVAALATPGNKRRSRIHPATRTFQALRIAVNHELENLDRLVGAAPRLLGKDGYVAIISYHSLEDGLVKRDFKQNQSQGIYQILTKKPIVPGEAEIAVNHRARSAKLRIAQKN
ncbi:MAG: 16S rRNA (cytosine(1402)-N(4))-methyltransferase RsmH [Sedimentisphaerales bacterium]|nr:16S rRNA (cytosine(1402)-N(4))-methyltransferase RsmH [Sedimentisphaerales bacterium]